MVKNVVLVPTDFSDVCNNAIEHGAEIARITNGELRILHVVNKDSKSQLKEFNKGPEYFSVQLKKIAGSIQDKYKIPVSPLIRQGSIFSEIRKAAKAESATLMVMGTHGKAGVQHLVGSFALRVISGIKIPVIVVQKRIFDNGYKRIVLPVGLDLGFLDKLHWTIQMAKIFDSEIHIFYYYNNKQDVNQTVAKVADLIKSKLILEGIRFREVKALFNKPYLRQLLEYAIAQRADLIILKARMEGLEAPVLFGHADEKMLFNESQIPVMYIS